MRSSRSTHRSFFVLVLSSGVIALLVCGGASAASADPARVTPTNGRASVSTPELSETASSDNSYTSSTSGSGITVDRVFGSDRYETAVAISRIAHPERAKTVFIATGEDYADALSVAPIAARVGPLLLTQKSTLPASVRAEIQRLEPDAIAVVGGPNAVSPAVVTELEKLQSMTYRLEGADRYATSLRVNQYGFGLYPAETVYVATGRNYPDALSAGAAAGARSLPVLLVDGQRDSLDAASRAFITNPATRFVNFVGGPQAISPAIVDSVRAPIHTSRLFGEDRYATARAINTDMVGTSDQVFLATGSSFPDALAGSVWAGLWGAPLYTVPSNCIPVETYQAIVAGGATNITLIGGPNTLSPALEALALCE